MPFGYSASSVVCHTACSCLLRLHSTTLCLYCSPEEKNPGSKYIHRSSFHCPPPAGQPATYYLYCLRRWLRQINKDVNAFGQRSALPPLVVPLCYSLSSGRLRLPSRCGLAGVAVGGERRNLRQQKINALASKPTLLFDCLRFACQALHG